nr:HEAT repeat domain-containing protein [Entomospira culicis]
MSFLKNTNKTSVRTGLSLIINPRDIQAISLANRLGAATPSEIGPILEQISRLESDAAVDIIVESLQSPKFEIRRKALATLENISSADQPPELTRALLQQLRNHPFSTAHVAARILGQHQISQAIPSLRRAVMSEDYRLKAEAITALGNLKDSSAILLIKRQIYHNNNHYVLVSSIQSLTTLLSVNDMYVLLWPLSWQKVEPTILNESILGAAKLLGILDRFYHRYLLWLHNQPEAYNELKEVMQAQKKTKPALKQSLEQIIFHHASQLDFMQQMRTFIQSCSKNDTPLMQSMLRICQNPLFTRYASLRFFMIYLLIWQLEEKKL